MKSRKRKVIFPQHRLVTTKGKSSAKATKFELESNSVMEHENNEVPTVDWFLLQPPLLRDALSGPTSELQDATLAECLPLLNGINSPSENPFDYDERGIKQLERDAHIAFAENALAQYPAPFVSIDASRPWMVYWALMTLYYLGEDVTSYSHRVVKTFFPLQNESGGYGGGQGHASHLAGTYATILSLALVRGREAYELTNRKAMWLWLGRLKQADGGFQICEGGEKDTRAAYCALLIVTLLNLPWSLPQDSPARAAGFQTFGDGLGEYISRCQTYEGGISSEPGTEAHGAYAYCALAALCLLGPPHTTVPQYLDIDHFLAWLTSRQYAPEGGLAGRTNKLVDGCYSHWIGSCFPLIQAALTGPSNAHEKQFDIGDLYSREGLRRYIQNCCQDPAGGLRDKPSKGPDIYHTCYTLTGLSTEAHYHYYTYQSTRPAGFTDDVSTRFQCVLSWRSVPKKQRLDNMQTSEGARGAFESFADHQGHSQHAVNSVHPVFVIPHDAVLSIREWAVEQPEIV